MRSLALATLLLTLAGASPVDTVVDQAASLQKRDTEIVYLANCQHTVSCCVGPVSYSKILYYAASADSQTGNPPAWANQCRLAGSSTVIWEGSSRSCTFSTGVTFTSYIDAGNHGAFTWSGWAANGFKNWDCYRDNGRRIFDDSSIPEAADVCNSIYYCTPQ